MKLNKILTAIAGTALLFGAVACSEDKYEPAPAFDGVEVYFSTADAQTVAIPEDATSVSVKLYRNGSDGEATVSLKSTVVDSEGNACESILTPATSVTFAAGADVVEIPVAVKFDQITPEEAYEITFTLDTEKQNPYGLSERTFKFSYAPWGPYQRIGGTEMAKFTLSGFGVQDEVAVYAAKSIVAGDTRARLQFGDAYCYDLNENENDWTWIVNGSNATVVIDSVARTAQMEPMGTYATYNGEEIFVTDAYTYVTEINPSALPEGSDPSDFYSVYRPEEGLIGLLTIYYISQGFIMQSPEYWQLPGYESYSLEATYVGNMYYNDLEEEAAKVSLYRSESIASMAYTLHEGALTSEEAKNALSEMLSEDNIEYIYDQKVDLEFYLREAGPYTMVMVGFDEAGESLYATYYTFNYKPSVPYTWRTLGMAEYTDGIISSGYGLEACTWDVVVEQHTENPGVLRLVNAYKPGNGWAYADQASTVHNGNDFVYFNIEDPTCVYIASDSRAGLALSSSEGMIKFYSKAGQMIESGRQPALVKRFGVAGTLDDEKHITFPASSLYIGLEDYNDGAWMESNLTDKVDVDDYRDPSGKVDTDAYYAEQLKYTGATYLDLSNFDLSGNAESVKVPYKYKAASVTVPSVRKAAAKGKNAKFILR